MTTGKGMRTDQWVKQRFPLLTNRHIDEAIAAGLVTLSNGKPVTKGDRLDNPDELLDVTRLKTHLEQLVKGNTEISVTIVNEYLDFWVVDKPAGLDSHPISLFDTHTATHWAFARLPELAREFSEHQPTITPHRLDGGTSGLLIVAKTKAAYDLWRERFHKKQVTKKYRAKCWGIPDRAYYLNQSAIAHHPSHKGKMVTVRHRYIPPVMESSTEFRVLEVYQNPDHFLCEVICHTGVTHQVRVHAADLGFPLIGDDLYDATFESRALKPPYHELRAIELKWLELKFSLNSVETITGRQG
jgi:23S rRNA pseudouridine1911/1915/1917 synthase